MIAPRTSETSTGKPDVEQSAEERHPFGGHQFGGHQFGGWLSDAPDRRDEPLYPPIGAELRAARAGGNDAELGDPPASAAVDWAIPVLQQRPLQSCVSCAVAAVVRHLDARGRPVTDPAPSPQFLYYNSRVAEGTRRCDVGSGIRSALKALNRSGLCTSDVWGPDKQVVEQPSTEAYQNAFFAGHVQYRRIFRLGEEPDTLDITPVKRAISDGLPVIFGFAVYDSFRAAAAGGPVPLPAPGERVLFGHAAVLIAYAGTTFTAVNSWGEEWGDNGRFALPETYLSDRRLTKDFWVLTSVSSDSRGPEAQRVRSA